jgi:ABC-type nitrate/sulfonate/bicarbonate transport system substrate-binding protein
MINEIKKRLGAILFLLAAFSLGLSNAPSLFAQETLTKVLIETQPYYDFKFFDVAEALGIDKEFGLDIDIITTPEQFSWRKLARGDVDIAASCPTCVLPAIGELPNLRDFMICQVFEGFVPIGRMKDGKPARKTYDEFLKENNGDVQKALEAFAKSLKGTSWSVTPEIQKANIQLMLAKGGLTLDDVKIIPFPDETKSALGFIHGEGDYYFGSLPQSVRLVTAPELKGQFVIAGTSKLFPTAFGTFAALQEWLDKNEETALRLYAVHFRTTRYLYEQPDRLLEIIAESLKAATGGLLTKEATLVALTKFNYFPRFEDARKTFFDPNSPTYFAPANKQLFEEAAKQGQFPKEITWDQIQVADKYFAKLEKRQDLIDIINAPLK